MDKKMTGKKLFVWLPAIPLCTMRTVRHLYGGITINDIVSTATSRAFWRYLVHCEEKRLRSSVAGSSDEVSLTIEQEDEKRAMEGESALKVRVLKASRSWTVSEAATMACWLKFPTTLQNRFGLCILHSKKPGFVKRTRQQKFDTSTDGAEEGLVSELLAKREEIRVCMKERRYGFGGFLLMSMFTNVLPRWFTNVLLKPPQGVSYVWSNLRGPVDAIECQGLPMTTAYTFPPNMGRAGNHNLLSDTVRPLLTKTPLNEVSNNNKVAFGICGRFRGVKCRKALRVTFFHLRGF